MIEVNSGGKVDPSFDGRRCGAAASTATLVSLSGQI
jgi:hypothetical protein